MTRIGIVGGQLQGLEAVYLARQAGLEAALIDKDPFVPAAALADEFYNIDLLDGGKMAECLLNEFDLILPATENSETLFWLSHTANRYNVPLALDMHAYGISSSKLKSNRLFALTGIPIPDRWPECGLPVIVKPSALSGSIGVEKVNDYARLNSLLNKAGRELVVQEYVEGPSYSLEVIGDRGKCLGLQVTELNFDAGYDCKRVIAGPNTGREIEDAFLELGDRIASVIKLSGIMDIEVIFDGKQLKVLEIDARLPSQTPTAVYHSTGVNMVSLLADYWIQGKLPARQELFGVKRAVIFEHLKFSRGTLETAGEHVMAGAPNLKIYKDRFFADVLITNLESSSEDWVATVVFTGGTEQQVWEVRDRAINSIIQYFDVKRYIDPFFNS